MIVLSNPVTVTQTSGMVPVSSKVLLDIQTTIECRYNLKFVRNMIKAYRQSNLSNLLFKLLKILRTFLITQDLIYLHLFLNEPIQSL